MQLSWAVQSDERAPPLRPALSGLPHRLNLPAGRRSPEHDSREAGLTSQRGMLCHMAMVLPSA